jgi:hypothetical protein
MGGKNSFARQVFNPGNIFGGGGGGSKPRSSSGTALTSTPTPTPPPAPPTTAAAGKTVEDLENKKRKAMGRESTVLTAGLGAGMNTTYSVNKPTLGA